MRTQSAKGSAGCWARPGRDEVDLYELRHACARPLLTPRLGDAVRWRARRTVATLARRPRGWRPALRVVSGAHRGRGLGRNEAVVTETCPDGFRPHAAPPRSTASPERRPPLHPWALTAVRVALTLPTRFSWARGEIMRALRRGVAVLLLTGVMAAPAAARDSGAEELSITKSS